MHGLSSEVEGGDAGAADMVWFANKLSVRITLLDRFVVRPVYGHRSL
jgi:hypothetical protein